MSTQRSGLSLKSLGYVSIPPNGNENCTRFGNMLRGMKNSEREYKYSQRVV